MEKLDEDDVVNFEYSINKLLSKFGNKRFKSIKDIAEWSGEDSFPIEFKFFSLRLVKNRLFIGKNNLVVEKWLEENGRENKEYIGEKCVHDILDVLGMLAYLYWDLKLDHSKLKRALQKIDAATRDL